MTTLTTDKIKPLLIEAPRAIYEQLIKLQCDIRTTTKKNVTIKELVITAINQYLEKINKPTSHKREVPNE